ncbi:MAG: hypothetical protein Alis3KO_36490 [Aliiglaciecola sp.]
MTKLYFQIAAIGALAFAVSTKAIGSDSLECPKPTVAIENVSALMNENTQTQILRKLACAANQQALLEENQLLMIAVQKGLHEVVTWAIANGAEVDQPDNRTMTPIMVAAQLGNSQILVKLANAGASLTRQASNGYATFDFALEGSHLDAMAKLTELHLRNLEQQSPAISTKVLKTKRNSLMFIKAIVEDNVGAVETLLNDDAKINVHNITNYAPLPLAVRLGNEPIVRLLLSHNANPNIGNDGNDEAIPLNQAVRGNRLGLIKLLLAAGSDINKENGRGYSALMLASLYGHKNLIAFLLGQNANINHVNHRGSDALMMAAAYGHAEIVEILLASGSQGKHQNNQGFSAMDYAIQQGHQDVVTRLVAHASGQSVANALFLASDPMKQSFTNDAIPPFILGHPPLNLVARFANKKSMKLLLAQGANPQQQSLTGYQTNALMNACQSGDLEAVKLLLGTNVDVNMQDGHGDPAINWAVAYGHQHIVKSLLDAGADPRIANKDGYTAIRTAQERGLTELAKTLSSHAIATAKRAEGK